MTSIRNIFPPVCSDEEAEILRMAEGILLSKVQMGAVLTSSELVTEYLRVKTGLLGQEVFGVMYLGNNHRLIEVEDMFFGTVNQAAVYPREIVRRVIHHNAAAVVLYHNHPTGDHEPTAGDIACTQRIKAALDTIDVRLLDHVVLSLTGSTSMAQRGML